MTEAYVTTTLKKSQPQDTVELIGESLWQSEFQSPFGSLDLLREHPVLRSEGTALGFERSAIELPEIVHFDDPEKVVSDRFSMTSSEIGHKFRNGGKHLA
jgi:hypothetical protein